MEMTENAIEFITGQKTCVATFTNRKHINRIRKLYEERGDEFTYLVENPDGSICAKFPLKWVRINPGAKFDPDKPKKEMSAEQRAKLAAGLQKYRENKNK